MVIVQRSGRPHSMWNTPNIINLLGFNLEVRTCQLIIIAELNKWCLFKPQQPWARAKKKKKKATEGLKIKLADAQKKQGRL